MFQMVISTLTYDSARIDDEESIVGDAVLERQEGDSGVPAQDYTLLVQDAVDIIYAQVDAALKLEGRAFLGEQTEKDLALQVVHLAHQASVFREDIEKEAMQDAGHGVLLALAAKSEPVVSLNRIRSIVRMHLMNKLRILLGMTSADSSEFETHRSRLATA